MIDWCCVMREKFLVGIIKENTFVSDPPDLADFLDWDNKMPDGRPVVITKYCCFCGHRIDNGPLRVV